jgi:hypothetical protein
MREAGRVVARTLAAVAAARPGVRPVDLDRLAADTIAAHGAKPSFLGYHRTWAPVSYRWCSACRSTRRSSTRSPTTARSARATCYPSTVVHMWTGTTATPS